MRVQGSGLAAEKKHYGFSSRLVYEEAQVERAEGLECGIHRDEGAAFVEPWEVAAYDDKDHWSQEEGGQRYHQRKRW